MRIPTVKFKNIDEIDEITNLCCNIFEVTEKLDGVPVSIIFNEGNIKICSNQNNGKKSVYISDMLSNIYKLNKYKLDKYIIQGELVGSGIDRNKLNLNKIQFFIHNIYDISKGVNLLPDDRLIFIINNLPGIPMIPIVTSNFKFDSFPDVDKIIELSEGISKLNRNEKREGLVFKSKMYNNNEIFSFKVMNKKY